jgi:hypothetical protein
MAGFAVSVGAGLGWYLLVDKEMAFGEIELTFVPALALAGFWWLGVGVLNLLAPPNEAPGVNRFWSLGVQFLLLADLLVAGWWLNPSVELAFYSRPSPTAEEVRPLLGGGRIYISGEEERTLKLERFLRVDTFILDEPWENLRAVLVPNTHMLDGLASANNFDPMVPGRYARWMEALEEASPLVRSQMLFRMDVGVVERIDAAKPLGVRFDTLESPGRARWVPCAQPVEGGEAALARVLTGEVDYLHTVVLEEVELPPDEGCSGQEFAPVEVMDESPNRVVVDVVDQSGGWLVLADVLYPGWMAYLDGGRAPLLCADYLFRAVELPPGEHVVEFVFRPWTFYGGGVLCILSWLIVGYFWFFWKKVDG